MSNDTSNESHIAGERRAIIEAYMNQHKLLERVQTIDQFKHILICETCTIDGDTCDFAVKQFPTVDPVELTLLNPRQSKEAQNKILRRVV